jgi:hypothetical protein
MSLGTAVERIAEINAALAPQRPAETTAPSGATDFARVLAATPAGGIGTATPVGLGGGALGAAQGEVGQAEQPPGSNDSPRIAMYREAVSPDAGVGPWCAYFVSWAARQGGVPLGPDGAGFASVDALYEWAEQSGRAIPAAAGPPAPGDLIVWDEHVGIVEAVLPDGGICTIEGNSGDRVERNRYGADGGGAIGYVRLG